MRGGCKKRAWLGALMVFLALLAVPRAAVGVGECVEGMYNLYDEGCAQEDIDDGGCTTRYEQTPPSYWCCCPDGYDPYTKTDPQCAFSTAAKQTLTPGVTLKVLRAVRDNLFSRSDIGRAYVALSYRHAHAVTLILLTHPLMVAQGAELLDTHLALFDQLAHGQQVTITSAEVDEIRSFLQQIDNAAGSNQLLKAAIQRVRGDLLNPQLLGTFGVTVTN